MKKRHIYLLNIESFYHIDFDNPPSANVHTSTLPLPPLPLPTNYQNNS